MIRKEDFICPKCKHKNRIKIYKVLEGNDINKILDKSIFKHKCKNCAEEVLVEYPLHVSGNNYFIYFTPGKDEELPPTKKPINRICDTYNDLKEKVLILEDDLDDVVIEIVKNKIRSKLKDLKIENVDEIREIRYNSKDNAYLSFSLVGIKEIVGLPIILYHDTLACTKIKKIDRSVLIDEFTYKKYIRGGHYEIGDKKWCNIFKW